VRNVTFLLGIALLPVTTPAAFAASPASLATAVLSSNRAGARPVVLTLSLRTELQCGRLMGGALVLKLPAQARLASSIPASAVLVGGKPAGSVVVAGHSLTIAVPRPRGAICDSITFGIAKLTVLRAARLGNPKTPGSYTIRLQHGSATFAATLKIHS
jgi:hypothetical protein